MNKYIFIFIFSVVFANETVDKNQEDSNWKTNFIPIVGQFKNQKYFKGIILGSLQTYSAYNLSHYNKSKQIGKRNTYAWWVLGLYFYGIIDAYVDTNLKNFPKNNNEDK